ncbi:MAG: glycosyltransferase family 2 protein, partial [Pseudomonadota bacterium]
MFRQSEIYTRFGMHNPHPRADFQAGVFRSVPGGHAKEAAPFGNHVAPPFGFEVAQVNHYAVRSTQAYLAKRSRGRANHSTETLGTEYWDRWNRGGMEDQSILRYQDEVNALLETFNADDVLRRQHKRAFRWHKALVSSLLERDEYQDLYARLVSKPPVQYVKKDRRIHKRLKADVAQGADDEQTGP